MADLSITAANVIAGAGAAKESGTAGETITAGQVVAKSSGKYVKADNNSGTAALRSPVGIALNGASLNQPITVQTAGDITIGGTMTAGAAYYLSDTPGGIGPAADLATGEYSVLLGMAKSTTVLALDIQASGVATA